MCKITETVGKVAIILKDDTVFSQKVTVAELRQQLEWEKVKCRCCGKKEFNQKCHKCATVMCPDCASPAPLNKCCNCRNKICWFQEY